MKSWYTSKTLWANAIAAIALLVQTRTDFLIDPEIQASLLTLINFILRLITKEPLNWGTPETPAVGGPGSSNAGFAALPLLIGLALLCLALGGCATTGQSTAGDHKDTPLQAAGKSLLAVKGSIVTAAQTTDTLCKTGQISTDKCIQARAAYDQARPAYDAAVDAYLLISAGGGDPAALSAAILRVQAIASNLLLITGGGAK